MRILAVSHPCVTDVNQQFYAELESLGHQLHLIVPSNFRTEYSVTEVSRWPSFSGMLEQRKVGLRQSIPLHFYPSSLRSSIERFRPDVMFVEEEPYSASAWQAFYASRDLPMKRVIYSAQNIKKQYPLPFRWMEQYVLSKADMAAVVSQEVGSVLAHKQFKGKILPFPLGVDTEQFRPMATERVSVRSELGIIDEFVIGYVGRFVEEKGIHTLIEAFPDLAASKLKFMFIGSGPLLENLHKAKERFPGLIYIANHVKHREVHKWLNAMDALVLPSLTKPSWKEQFGRVMVEAMACQVPVIGSDSGEIPVIIRETGGGWVVPQGNPNALSELIRRISTDRQDVMDKATSGYLSVHTKFSKRALAKSFEQQIIQLFEPSVRLNE